MSATHSYCVPWKAADGREEDGLAPARLVVAVLARLHDRRVQVEVVRHHRRAEDPDGDEQHVGIADDVRCRHEARDDPGQARLREEEFDRKPARNADDERDHHRFEHPEAVLLEHQEDQYVSRRDEHAEEERNAEQQLERDGRPEHFSQVAGRDGDLGPDPEQDRGAPRIVSAAGLGQVEAGGDAEPRGERLQQNRHQVRDHDDAEQLVAEARAAGDVRGPVARVHVADRDEVARAGESEELPPESRVDGDRNGPVDL
jgi:hypothetical protein